MCSLGDDECSEKLEANSLRFKAKEFENWVRWFLVGLLCCTVLGSGFRG